MIDAEMLEDLHRTFAAALSHESPDTARTALLAAGWLESLDADETVAVGIVFRIQGATLHDAAALDDIISDAWPSVGPTPLATWQSAYPVPAGPRFGRPDSRVVTWPPTGMHNGCCGQND